MKKILEVIKMSSYTMTISDIVDNYSHGYPFNNVRDKIEVARQQIFDFDYPIFDETYRKIFETNFLRRFYTREIGFETDGLFKFQLETWLLIHMPYFNNLYESELIKFDPLINSSVDITHTQKNDKTQNDNKDVTQNTTGNQTSNVVQTEATNLVGNVDSTGSQDVLNNSTSNVVGSSDSTGTQGVITSDTSNVIGSSDSIGSNDAVTKETGTGDSTSTVTEDEFERKLRSDTPDSRLAITTNDGQGVIQYASTIDEKNENGTEKTVGTSADTKNTNATIDTTDSTDTVSDTTNAGKSDTLTSNNNDTTSNTIDEGTSATDSTSNTNTVQDTIGNSTGDSTVDTTGQSIQNDKLISSVNELEDFVQHRVGKIGIQTYSEMLVKYRSTFLRIEQKMFREMNELFMLVY